MNIVHVGSNRSFVGKFILPLACAQQKSGSKVFIPYCGVNNHSDSINFFSLPDKIGRNLKKIIVSIKILINIIREEKIDAIFLHTSIDSCILLVLLRIASPVNVYYVNHGVPFVGYTGLIRYALKLIEVLNVGFSHKTFAISETMGRYLASVNYFNKAVISFLPGTICGVDIHYESIAQLREKRNRCVGDPKILKILYVGRPVKRKGLFEILDVVKKLDRDYVLYLAGVTPEDIQQYLPNERILPLGYVDHLSSVYLNSDVLCVLSQHEGFGQVYLEAAAHGVIPICSDIPGPKDFVKDMHNGYTVQIGDEARILEVLNSFEVGREKELTMQENAFNSAKKYERALILQNNVKVIRENLSNN